MRRIRSVSGGWVCLALAFGLLAPAAAMAQATATKPKAKKEVKAQVSTTPVPRADKWWTDRFESMNKRVKQGKVDLIFVGDSITQGWESAAKVWNEFYGKRGAVNLGIGGDQTQHVIYRLEHGNLADIQPKLAVVMIGTNNAGSGQKAEDIAAGVKAVVQTLRKRTPQTKILLLAIFPRDAGVDGRLRKVNTQANALIAKFDDGKDVTFLDIGPKFLQADGTLPKEIMPDLLHLSGKGYQIWAEAIEPAVAKVMGPK